MKTEQTYNVNGANYLIVQHPHWNYFSIREVNESGEEVPFGFDFTVQDVYSGNHADHLIEVYENETEYDLVRYVVDNWHY